MKTLVFRNADNSTRVEVQVDIFATNEDLLISGYETRFTNMQIVGNTDAAKVLGIDTKEIENSFQSIVAKAKSLNLGLYALDATYANEATQSHEEEVTLTGTSGTAEVTINGVEYTATFSSDLTTTAANFDSTHSTALTALGIEVTNASGVLTVTRAAGGLEITVANATGDLAGASVETALYQSGNGEMTIVPAIA